MKEFYSFLYNKPWEAIFIRRKNFTSMKALRKRLLQYLSKFVFDLGVHFLLISTFERFKTFPYVTKHKHTNSQTRAQTHTLGSRWRCCSLSHVFNNLLPRPLRLEFSFNFLIRSGGKQRNKTLFESFSSIHHRPTKIQKENKRVRNGEQKKSYKEKGERQAASKVSSINRTYTFIQPSYFCFTFLFRNSFLPFPH